MLELNNADAEQFENLLSHLYCFFDIRGNNGSKGGTDGRNSEDDEICKGSLDMSELNSFTIRAALLLTPCQLQKDRLCYLLPRCQKQRKSFCSRPSTGRIFP